jgi:hypothetical protein
MVDVLISFFFLQSPPNQKLKKNQNFWIRLPNAGAARAGGQGTRALANSLFFQLRQVTARVYCCPGIPLSLSPRRLIAILLLL